MGDCRTTVGLFCAAHSRTHGLSNAVVLITFGSFVPFIGVHREIVCWRGLRRHVWSEQYAYPTVTGCACSKKALHCKPQTHSCGPMPI